MSLAANFSASNLWWPAVVFILVGAGQAVISGALQRRRDKRQLRGQP